MIGGYDLLDPADRIIPFDYDGSGRLDHLLLYRPGQGTVYILRNSAGVFAPVFAEGAPGNGIGGYDLADPADRIIPFDYDGSGRLDHLLLYRPGAGTVYIMRNNAGAFAPVFAEGAPGNGIGGYDLADPADRIIPFDYDGSGRLDHLLLYRPGTGTVYIMRNNAGVFTPVFAEGAPGNGIGGYDLADPADRIIPFDYNGSGRLDHLLLYRPGQRTVWILRNNAGTFAPVLTSGDGIGGYDLADPADRIIPFDYDGSGRLDHLLLYRPGQRTVWILRNNAGTFGPVLTSGDGIGGYDLADPVDQIISFDYNGSGRLDHLVLYRPGQGAVWILRNTGGTFGPVLNDTPAPLLSSFAGTATLVTTSSDARLASPSPLPVSATFEFSLDRASVRIVDLSPIGPISIPGASTLTITRRPGEPPGQFQRGSGTLTVPIGLHFDFSFEVPFALGDADVAFGFPTGNPLTTGSATSPSGALSATGTSVDPATGAVTLVGASRFSGGPPLGGLECTITMAGRLTPVP